MTPIYDFEGNDVTGCRFCELIQTRDWETLSLEDPECTCDLPTSNEGWREFMEERGFEVVPSRPEDKASE